MTRIDVVHVGVLQGPDRNTVFARPDSRTAFFQTEVPHLRVHKHGVFAVDVLFRGENGVGVGEEWANWRERKKNSTTNPKPAGIARVVQVAGDPARDRAGGSVVTHPSAAAENANIILSVV